MSSSSRSGACSAICARASAAEPASPATSTPAMPASSRRVRARAGGSSSTISSRIGALMAAGLPRHPDSGHQQAPAEVGIALDPLRVVGAVVVLEQVLDPEHVHALD